MLTRVKPVFAGQNKTESSYSSLSLDQITPINNQVNIQAKTFRVLKPSITAF